MSRRTPWVLRDGDSQRLNDVQRRRGLPSLRRRAAILVRRCRVRHDPRDRAQHPSRLTVRRMHSALQRSEVAPTSRWNEPRSEASSMRCITPCARQQRLGQRPLAEVTALPSVGSPPAKSPVGRLLRGNFEPGRGRRGVPHRPGPAHRRRGCRGFHLWNDTIPTRRYTRAASAPSATTRRMPSGTDGWDSGCPPPSPGCQDS